MSKVLTRYVPMSWPHVASRQPEPKQLFSQLAVMTGASSSSPAFQTAASIVEICSAESWTGIRQFPPLMRDEPQSHSTVIICEQRMVCMSLTATLNLHFGTNNKICWSSLFMMISSCIIQTTLLLVGLWSLMKLFDELSLKMGRCWKMASSPRSWCRWPLLHP